MADSPAFDWTCEALENETDLDRLEARGTVRLALKSSGLLAANVRSDQMRVVLERVMPAELTARGVPSASDLCCRLAEGVLAVATDVTDESPDDVFRRLGGS